MTNCEYCIHINEAFLEKSYEDQTQKKRCKRSGLIIKTREIKNRCPKFEASEYGKLKMAMEKEDEKAIERQVEEKWYRIYMKGKPVPKHYAEKFEKERASKKE